VPLTSTLVPLVDRSRRTVTVSAMDCTDVNHCKFVGLNSTNRFCCSVNVSALIAGPKPHRQNSRSSTMTAERLNTGAVIPGPPPVGDIPASHTELHAYRVLTTCTAEPESPPVKPKQKIESRKQKADEESES
jgi:hypothetical protein